MIIVVLLASFSLSLVLTRSCLRTIAGARIFDMQIAKVIFYAVVAFDVYATYSLFFPAVGERRDGLEIIAIPILAFIQTFAACVAMIAGQVLSDVARWLLKRSRRF